MYLNQRETKKRKKKKDPAKRKDQIQRQCQVLCIVIKSVTVSLGAFLRTVLQLLASD